MNIKSNILIKENSKLDLFFKKHLNSNQFTYQEIFSMLGPLIMDQLFISIINLLTTAMISSSSQDSVSAVSLVGPLYMIVYSVFAAISVGGTVVIAQYKGKNDQRKVERAAGQIIMASTILALISCLLLAVFARQIIYFMYSSANEVVLKKATEYLIGVSISQIFLALYLAPFSIFRGLGDSKKCLKLTIVINLAHLIASYLFINILKLDILGTTLSLNIARLLGAIASYYYLLHPNGLVKVKKHDIFIIDFKILKSMISLSVPYALEQILFQAGNMLVQRYIVKLGTISTAANAITNSAFNIVYTTGISVSTLATIIVGQCAGAGEKELARKYGSKMISLTTIVLIISNIFILPLMPFILKMYQAPPETLSLIYSLLWIAIIPMPLFWAPANTIPSILRSTGDSAFPSWISLITMWIFRVILGYVLVIRLNFTVKAIWYCLGIEWAVKTFIFYIRFKSNIWLDKLNID